MSKEDSAIFGCILLIPVTILSYALRAWAIITLWTWFIWPTWKVPIPTSESAIGLSILVGMLTSHSPDRKDGDDSYPILSKYVFVLTLPILSVGIGWCVRWWFAR